MTMVDVPIFLAGIDRSGIGLLGEILEAHPDVAVTRRINFWDFYAGRYGDLRRPENLELCVADMMRYTRIQRLQIDPVQLKADFELGKASYPRLFALLQEQNLRRLGKTRWCDKSLGAEGHADEILSAFPEAVMIQVVRDPRDRYASRSTHRTSDRGGVGSGTAAWLWSARLATKHREIFPSRFLSIRYEDLVADPETTLSSVCEFARLRFTAAMLRLPGTGEESGSVLHNRSIGRFRSDLRVGEIRFIEWAAARDMPAWGYEPSGTEWTTVEKTRFAFSGLPVAVAGLTLWRPWTRLQKIGRTRPSRRRSSLYKGVE